MSDLQLRLALRAYDAYPTFQNAAAFIREYHKAFADTDWTSLRQDINRQLGQENTGFRDQGTLTYDLINFFPDNEEEQEIYDEITDWVETVASFSHNSSEYVWEHLVYLGALYDSGPHQLVDDADPSNFARTRAEGSAPHLIPTPEPLVPIIEEAMRLGAWYIAFNAG